jgi:hypothetical protein
MLLGELLIREGVITQKQLERALRLREEVQVRLGSTLVELGYVDVDTLARALSAQHRVPAVLTKHVTAIDPKVIGLFPSRVAASHNAIPVGYTQSKPPRLVVAFRDPTTTPIDDIAFAAGTRVEIGVAPEMLIRRCLAKYYGLETKKYIEVDVAEMHRSPSSDPPAPEAPVAKAPLPVLEVPSIEEVMEPAKTLSSPPSPAPVPAIAPPPPPPAPPVAEMPIARSAAQSPVEAPEPVMIFKTPPPSGNELVADALPPDEGWDDDAAAAVAGPMTAPPGILLPVLGVDEALEALKAAKSRDEIGDTLAAWLQSAYGFGIVLIVKDGLGMALAWRGHARDIEPSAIESIAMPLGPPSMLTSAYDGKTSFRGPPPEEGMPIQRKLWNLLRCETPKEVLVIPVLVGNRVVNILYSHVMKDGALADTALEDAARVAAAAATAYARLIRKTK